jgi:glucose/arabinose dehydrogenase
MKWLTFLGLLLLSVTTHAQTAQPITIRLTPLARGLTAPVAFAAAPDGRLLVVEQIGKIKLIKNGQLQPQPFLDLTGKLDRISGMYSEKGLLGLALHPQFAANGKLYVYYSARKTAPDLNHGSIVAEYTMSPDPDTHTDRADANSERILLTIGQPESNHNGGHLAFGPDGYLYIGSGDGGGAGDRHGAIGNGQALTTLLGKILRIDVNRQEGSKPYAIPPDNPFANRTPTTYSNAPTARAEIFAYGLRNPWKFSFDAQGRLWAADVGQDKYEEIDLIEKGKNYGWRIMEGLHCFNPPTGCDDKNLVPPIHEYDHGLGNSITGGYVYRGTRIAALRGKYVFGDWSGKLFYLAQVNGAWQRGELHIVGKDGNRPGAYVNSFGEDAAGELYVLTNENMGPSGTGGAVWRIDP